MLMMKALSSCSLTSPNFYVQDGEEAFKSFLFVDDLSVYCMHPHTVFSLLFTIFRS